MAKDWNNTQYSCHICSNQGDCKIRPDLWDFINKHDEKQQPTGLGLKMDAGIHICLETDIAKFCSKFKKEVSNGD